MKYRERMDFMKNKFAIIGGDMRLVNLVKMLQKDGYSICTYALEKAEELKGLECNSLQEAIASSEIIMSSIPLSKDGNYVNTPLSSESLTIKELQQNLKGKKFMAGKIPENLKNDKEIETYDFLEIEEYAILNAIATAEGAIQIAMEEYPKTLSGSNILVMGFGRIGKVISKMLQGIGAKVFCEARKNEDLAYIKAYGYTPIHLNELEQTLSQFDIIFNNIPVQILDKKRLDLLKKEVLVIDLASSPGGVDFEYAKAKNIKTIWALALPGKCAPISAAEYIRDTIYSIERKM